MDAPEDRSESDRVFLIRHIRVPVRIVYPDGYGGEFACRVDLNAIYRLESEVYLVGYCPDLNGVRTFRLCRVRSITDLVTGHVYDRPVRFVQGLDVFDGSPEMDQLRSMIHVLVYLARCDGHYAGQEKDVLEGLVRGWCSEVGGNPELLVRYASRIKVDEEGFCQELGTMATLPRSVRQLLLRTARTLAEASGGVKPEEVAVLEQLAAAG